MAESRQKLVVPAGEFSAWLACYQQVQAQPAECSEVPCGDCNACCRASYFVYIRPEEHSALRRIPPVHLQKAPPPYPAGFVMDHDEAGCCPMLHDGSCSIYDERPQTCRNYDCRAFAAAGLRFGPGPRANVDRRVGQWSFDYGSEFERSRHHAVCAAATFLKARRAMLPAGVVPLDPGELARAAIAVHGLFVEMHGTAFSVTPASDAELIAAVLRRLERLGR